MGWQKKQQITENNMKLDQGSVRNLAARVLWLGLVIIIV